MYISRCISVDDIVKAVLIRGGMLVEEDFGDFRSPGKLRFWRFWVSG